MNYRTSQPIVVKAGISNTISRGELLQSPHREVRQQAGHMRAFVFGGVHFTPILDTTAYGRSRVTSLSGFPVVSQDKASEALRSTLDQRVRSEQGRSPTPSNLKLSEQGAAPQAVMLKPSKALPVIFLTVCALIGVFVGAKLAKDETVIHWVGIECDSHTRGCQ